jgi:hypothetical protein
MNNEGIPPNSPLLDSKKNPSNWRPGNIASPPPPYTPKARVSCFGLPPGPKGNAT